ncbi:MAG: hypothetical protein JOY90_22540 [Bradyrhizobium sp.]|uniref:hypothetical protein n=1 Tax=Bradyrhizobium sp. TaxID=376 RepID=UPI001D77CC23|nr:hypothetical protein [Bradyrhizobium sp.]MBV9563196.1 hypothetical protein [Bradyrhizobium sp.]
MSEFIEVRCHPYRFLVPSADIVSIELLDACMEPFPEARVPRSPLVLDGRALASGGLARPIERGVALRLEVSGRIEARIVVDQTGALMRLDAKAFEPLPRAVAALRPFFFGVWRDPSLQEYLFCLRPRYELPINSFASRRRIRHAALIAAAGDRRTLR